jgi:hypothetical protein
MAGLLNFMTTKQIMKGSAYRFNPEIIDNKKVKTNKKTMTRNFNNTIKPEQMPPQKKPPPGHSFVVPI